MIVSTQISGNIRPGNNALDAIINTLGTIGVHAANPSDDGLFHINSQHPAWHHYDTELALYESIAEAPFHIILNDGEIDESVGRQILYALSKNRPIIMTGVPKFDADISPFTRETILNHVSQFHAINLAGLEKDEMQRLIDAVSPQDYQLTDSEKILIRAKIRSHFRRLLEEARDIYVEKH